MRFFSVVLAAACFLAPAVAAAQGAKAPAKASAQKAPSKGAAPKGKKGASSTKGKAPRKAGSEPGDADEATRRIIAGTSQATGRSTKESAELRAMREMDAALFPSAAPPTAPVWPADGLVIQSDGVPRVTASGLPPSIELLPAPGEAAQADLAWLKKLDMPDIPVRWDARVVRYLEYYKNNARARSMVAGWIKKSGKYGGSIRRVLHDQGLPEDILWLALVESGFDPTISSPAGAAGLWQFMPEGARIYGLTIDRWVDERLDPERSTVAAAKYLADLHQRFASWELAFAAYNMGYGGLLSSIRKYNTNDFWELSRLESGMPLETALYVPKIVAMAVVARNRAVFGCDDVDLDPAITFDKVAVGPGVSTRAIALASGASEATIDDLNPQLLATRTPPTAPAKQDGWTVRVPAGSGQKAAKSVTKLAEADSKLERITLRWGETLDDIAQARKLTRSSLAALNGLRRDEVLRPGTVVVVPASSGVGVAAAAAPAAARDRDKPVVVAPSQSFAYEGRKRWFYRVVPGDMIRDVASVFGVAPDEVCRWNVLDAGAALHDGMTLQIYAPAGAPHDNVLAIEDKDARVLPVGSQEFFAYFEGLKGRKRVEVVAKEGDTWRGLAHRYGLTIAQMERINQRERSSPLAGGDKLVVYVPSSKAPADKTEEEKPDVAVASANPVGDDAAPKDDDSPRPPPATAAANATARRAP